MVYPDLPVRTLRRKPLDPLLAGFQTRKIDDARTLLLRSAQESDCGERVDEGCIVREGHETKIVYLPLAPLEEDFTLLVSALRRMRYDVTERSSGMTTRSRVFGYEPRKTLRKDYCSTTSLFADDRDAFLLLCDTARRCDAYYRHYHPTLYAQHEAILRNKFTSPQEWHLPGSVFTSGIVNQNNPLPYHFDTGNFERVWSAMLVFKGEGVEGGHLAVPQYDLLFTLPDRSLFLFDGQGLLHGVTPIVRTQPDSYRYSVVYYALQGMWKCEPPLVEAGRFNRLATAREDRRPDAATADGDA